MKERLDILLVQKGLVASREKAKALIMAGAVFVDHQREDKAGAKFQVNQLFEVKATEQEYVSRGGLKLAKGIALFNINLAECVCMDIGASTGGFTDCMLQNGASKVYSVDVGYGQLAWKLRQDDRVICLEKTNARYLSEEEVPEKVDFVSIDVAFISIRKILPAVSQRMKEGAEGLFLIKPQFEAGRQDVGKKGVVKDRAVHYRVIDEIIAFTLGQGFKFCGVTYSPITGPAGNIEYLLHVQKQTESVQDEYSEDLIRKQIQQQVVAAHDEHRSDK